MEKQFTQLLQQQGVRYALCHNHNLDTSLCTFQSLVAYYREHSLYSQQEPSLKTVIDTFCYTAPNCHII